MNKPRRLTSVDKAISYWLNNRLHREDGPAIIQPNGDKSWWLNGKHHRSDGPAVIWSNGYKEWWLDGKRHREDGPAVIHPNGTIQFFLNHKRLSFDEYKAWFLKKISNPSYELTDGDIGFIKKYLE